MRLPCLSNLMNLYSPFLAPWSNTTHQGLPCPSANGETFLACCLYSEPLSACTYPFTIHLLYSVDSYSVVGKLSTNTFSILSNQFLAPVGYSSLISGALGATLLGSGIIASLASAPLYDRIFTRHLGLSIQISCPIVAGSWIGLIFAGMSAFTIIFLMRADSGAQVKPHNIGVLFPLIAIIGSISVTLLPITLELAVELTRNAESSSAFLWLL